MSTPTQADWDDYGMGILNDDDMDDLERPPMSKAEREAIDAVLEQARAKAAARKARRRGRA